MATTERSRPAREITPDPMRQSRAGVLDDAARFATALREHYTALVETLGEELEQAPYRTLGAASGVGFVLGSILRPGAVAVLLDVGARFALAQALNRLQTTRPGAVANDAAVGRP